VMSPWKRDWDAVGEGERRWGTVVADRKEAQPPLEPSCLVSPFRGQGKTVFPSRERGGRLYLGDGES